MLVEFLLIFGEGFIREIYLFLMDGGVFSLRSLRKVCYCFFVLGFLG